jgi:hypothetical protein
MDTPVSKSQKRAMSLLGITEPNYYADAAKALEAKRVEGDGIPAGHSWRTAAKLTDAELLAELAATEVMRDEQRSAEPIDRY